MVVKTDRREQLHLDDPSFDGLVDYPDCPHRTAIPACSPNADQGAALWPRACGPLGRIRANAAQHRTLWCGEPAVAQNGPPRRVWPWIVVVCNRMWPTVVKRAVKERGSSGRSCSFFVQFWRPLLTTHTSRCLASPLEQESCPRIGHGDACAEKAGRTTECRRRRCRQIRHVGQSSFRNRGRANSLNAG